MHLILRDFKQDSTSPSVQRQDIGKIAQFMTFIMDLRRRKHAALPIRKRERRHDFSGLPDMGCGATL
tara:strand:- start:1343 stop:1543 length:201 start_codon:yes stop_codon:yes gene_type:complete